MDTALLTPDPDEGLLVLEVKRESMSGWRLPGTFLWEGERLADAVRRSLRAKARVEGVAPHQLRVFDDPNRDDRGLGAVGGALGGRASRPADFTV